MLVRVRVCLFNVVVVVFPHPTPRHLDGLGPPFVHADTLLGRDIGFKGGTVGAVHVLQVGKVLPHTDCKRGSNGGTEGGSLVHGGAFDGDLDDVCLSLEEGKVSN